MSFDFGLEGYVCMSIETRMTKGQAYSALAGLYRQFALYYVIGDERDIVRLRIPWAAPQAAIVSTIHIWVR